MGFRFYRRIQILPGLRLNISKSGVSTSVGTRGLWLTTGHGRRRATIGLPGTGLSYTASEQSTQPEVEQSTKPEVEQSTQPEVDKSLGWNRRVPGVVVLIVILAVIYFTTWLLE